VEPLAGANPWLLAAALASVPAYTWARAMRWRLMFAGRGRSLPRAPFFGALLAGQALNAAIPARVGELARATSSAPARRGPRLCPVERGAEKILDTLTLLLALAALAAWGPLPAWLREAGWTLAGLTAAAVAALVVLMAGRGRAVDWLVRREAASGLWRRLRLRRLLLAVAEGLALLRELPRLGGLAAWSLAGLRGRSPPTGWWAGRCTCRYRGRRPGCCW
jgi:hypothetical protein